jgi:hypothetical protein
VLEPKLAFELEALSFMAQANIPVGVGATLPFP